MGAVDKGARALGDPAGAARGKRGKGYKQFQRIVDPFDLAGFQKQAGTEEALRDFDASGRGIDEAIAGLPQYEDALGRLGAGGDLTTSGLASGTLADLQKSLGGISGISDSSKFGGFGRAGEGLTRATADIERLRGLGTGSLQGLASEQLTAQRLRQQQAGQDLQSRLAGQAAGQRSALAASGGLSGGARERLAGKLGRQSLIEQQRLGAQGALSEADILAGARQQQLGILGSLSGQEAGLAQGQLGLAGFERGTQQLQSDFALRKALAEQQAREGDIGRTVQAKQFDIGNILEEQRAREQAKLKRGELGLQARSAQQLGRSQIRSSGAGGGLIGGLFGG